MMLYDIKYCYACIIYDFTGVFIESLKSSIAMKIFNYWLTDPVWSSG